MARLQGGRAAVRALGLGLLLGLSAALARAEVSPLREAGVSPLLGAWAVDTTRLPMPPEARPKAVTLRFAAETGGRLRMTVDVELPNGAALHADGVTPLDGSATAVPANFEADVSASLMPQPQVLVLQLARGGQPASTRIYTVAADGRSMTETVAHFNAEGRPVLRTNWFTRPP
jgi:hypothetical protein